MKRRFTKYPSGYVRASSYDSDVWNMELSIDYGIRGLHNNNLQEVIRDVLNEYGCKVNGFSYATSDYVNSEEYADYEVNQVVVSFTCEFTCDEHSMTKRLEKELYNSGYYVIDYVYSE
jgi:hypothetical protein